MTVPVDIPSPSHHSAMLVAAECAAGMHIPRFHSTLTHGELDACNSVHSACLQLQETLNAHRAARLAQMSSDNQCLKMIELYNRTLSHLDAACDGLYEITSL